MTDDVNITLKPGQVGRMFAPSGEAIPVLWRDPMGRYVKVRASGSDTQSPPPVPEPEPGPQPVFADGFGRNAKGGAVTISVSTTAELEAAVETAGSHIVPKPGFTGIVEHGRLDLAERVSLFGLRLRGDAIWPNTDDIIARCLLIGTGDNQDIITFKTGKHDWLVTRNTLRHEGNPPDGWLDATRGCYNGTVSYNRFEGRKGNSHNFTCLFSNGTHSISFHHNLGIDIGYRFPKGGRSDDGGPTSGPLVVDSVGNVVDGFDDYGLVCQQHSTMNSRNESYYDTDSPVGRCVDLDTSTAKLYQVGARFNGQPFTERNVTTPFLVPEWARIPELTPADDEALTRQYAGMPA
jgi:hypothetical protein